MKFDMGNQALQTLMSGSKTSNQDLGALVKQLVAAAEPLEGKFNGQGKQMFDSFKSRADEIANALNSSLSAILGGQSGMEQAFGQGDQEQGQNAKTNMTSARFDAARFGAR
ncbi:hypothetical protein ACFV4F_20515 [Kitasatospora sp. NPDC059722]|uniref:hypothetical protein n=1 Tax=unclassified Kitasatospora TaxID=2633591 RepID=UPI00365BC1AC